MSCQSEGQGDPILRSVLAMPALRCVACRQTLDLSVLCSSCLCSGRHTTSVPTGCAGKCSAVPAGKLLPSVKYWFSGLMCFSVAFLVYYLMESGVFVVSSTSSSPERMNLVRERQCYCKSSKPGPFSMCFTKAQLVYHVL